MHRLPRSLTLRQHQHHGWSRRPSPRIPRQPQRRWQSQIMYKQTGEPVRFQAVRFKRPALTLRRIATIGIYTGVVYGYSRLMWRYMDVEIEFVDEGEEQEAVVAQEHGQNQEAPTTSTVGEANEEDEGDEVDGPPFYADEENTFIPLTWSSKLPRTFYKGSDPEWQEFLKVAQDKARHKRIQDELVQLVYSGSVSHPSIARQVGTQPKIGKYWLDISFPDGPPPEYERSGIEIGDGFVAWSQQRVSQEKQWRLMRALWPQATAQGTWATVKVLSGIQWRRLKQMIGWEEADPMAIEERWRLASEMVGKQQREDAAGKRGVMEKQPNGSDSPSLSRAEAGFPPQQQSTRPSTSSPTDPSNKLLPWLPSVPIPHTSPTTTTDIPIAMHVFSSALSKNWNPKKMEPPRGTFVVQGLVEVRGQRGRILFDVASSYDPKAGKYVQVHAGVRNFKRWKQAPRGGG